MVNFLLSRNSNPQSKDVRGITPLDLAHHKGTMGEELIKIKK